MKPAFGMGRTMWLYHIVVMLLSLLFVSMLGDAFWLQALLNCVLLFGYGYMLFSDGCVRGERAATLSVQLDNQRTEGRPIAPEQEALTFRKKTAYIGYAIGVLPLLIIALLNLGAEPFYPEFKPATDEEIALIEQQLNQASSSMLMPELEEGAVPEKAEPTAETVPAAEATSAEPVNWFSIVARVAFSPYLFTYTPLMNQPHLLYLLFVAFALAIPVAEPIGYLQGPRLRQKKLEMIQKGKRKKMRNLKVNNKPNTPKKPKMEV